MTKGKVEKAERIALNNLDSWNETTGLLDDDSGYFYEIQDIILDAVHIGIQMALNGKVEFDSDGNVKKEGQTYNK